MEGGGEREGVEKEEEGEEEKEKGEGGGGGKEEREEELKTISRVHNNIVMNSYIC